MKVTLIKPNIGRLLRGPYIDEGRMQPLQIGVLAGLTAQRHAVVFFDDRMEEIPFATPLTWSLSRWRPSPPNALTRLPANTASAVFPS